MKKNRAFLKWAGGKYPLVEEIRRYLPEGDCLIEPFVGAGSVFLNTEYDRYILADINSDLINLYDIVKTQTDDFIRDARELFTDEYNVAEIFYLLRDEFNLCAVPYRRAVLFLYLNRHCYNGLCRYNMRGEFNVPFGRYKKPYFPEEELRWFALKARNATFVCEHYQQTLLKATQGAVVYCDPPYAPLSATANFTAYHTNNFNNIDQQSLATLAYRLSVESAIPVLISNHDTELTRAWYQDAALYVVRARRTISRNIMGRSKVNELLALYGAPLR
ncbi:adenine-specific DNA-methyltransferase [Candidatus Symbiopectobacterium sp. NZEC135]|uniref:adenine-specific DNA-methyltransferase n=1 Tax=unclassified Symbiopectobacterium TaxID=2794573 RepID=UPI0022265DBF|nr:adenine-specific DNA-methyltransferase [Candidatus Symbiopectobacterium sp. NZEC135]MCW2479306.1 adenine-specific DNA-methyltransferase [Candidatus Symbiopectobacterium sp. NZEC135]